MKQNLIFFFRLYGSLDKWLIYKSLHFYGTARKGHLNVYMLHV